MFNLRFVLYILAFGSINCFVNRISRISSTTSLNYKVNIKFLESNTWLWEVGDISILVDPVMDTLDFGIPFFYEGKKRYIDGTTELNKISPKIDYVLISQGLDDHAHGKTLARLSKICPLARYIAPPSATSTLKSCSILNSQVTLLSPGQSIMLQKGKINLKLTATNGALVGPPWQSPENGYILSSSPSIYYEPHCMYNPSELSKYEVDCVITPIVSQELPLFTLVDGGEKALNLARILKAKTIVPMSNGELIQSGILSKLVRTNGSKDEFKEMVMKSGMNIKVVDAPAGISVVL